VQDLQPAAVRQQLVHRREVEPGQRVDQVAIAFGGQLHQAKLGMVGALAHELGVERQPLRTVHPEQGGFESRLIDN
jgi:hypothetical protein